MRWQHAPVFFEPLCYYGASTERNQVRGLEVVLAGSLRCTPGGPPRGSGEGSAAAGGARRRVRKALEPGALLRVVIMAIDWIGFGYAIVVALGGVVGYTRKGSIVSLVAGLFFGLMSGYGAYCVTHDSRDVKISFFSAFILTIVMGMRFKRSKKLIPGGLIAGLSLLMILRLVFLLL
ncbi:transmembrane protein 14A isoform X1 [Mauremys mutica]|nr:transmembrane protein 14A isoform X1 [Mauremys mutica]